MSNTDAVLGISADIANAKRDEVDRYVRDHKPRYLNETSHLPAVVLFRRKDTIVQDLEKEFLEVRSIE